MDEEKIVVKVEDNRLTREQKFELYQTLGRWVVMGVIVCVAFITRVFI